MNHAVFEKNRINSLYVTLQIKVVTIFVTV